MRKNNRNQNNNKWFDIMMKIERTMKRKKGVYDYNNTIQLGKYNTLLLCVATHLFLGIKLTSMAILGLPNGQPL